MPQFYAYGETRYVVGVDLGQSSDPTAIAVLQHRKATALALRSLFLISA